MKVTQVISLLEDPKTASINLKDFEDVRANRIHSELLENQLVVPVVMKVPGHIMGSGLGMSRP
jgi:hypothetical protein